MSDWKANNAIKSFNIKYVSIYNEKIKKKLIDDSRKQAKLLQLSDFKQQQK